MNKNNLVILSERQIAEIKALASEARSFLGVYPSVPVGNDIRMFLEKKDILLCEYPFSESGDTHTYGNIVMFKTGDETITFIGLNTASYYDEQIFAIAHEIYHFTTKTGRAYSSELDEEDKETEKKADRFAAEFLLPADILKDLVALAFDTLDLKDVPEARLLRFVARLQCDWWLPYQAIINRLFEEKHITRAQYDSLYEIDCRSEESLYRRILSSTEDKIAELLNTKTMTIGVSSRIIDAIINNYEDGYIDDDELVRLLGLFEKNPEDYGIKILAELDEDLMEMAESEDDE